MQKEKKKLGAFDIYSLGVGGTIGSGIFVMLGLGIMFTGRSAGLAVLIGCVYITLAYFYHPIMASLFVLPGGDYDAKAMLFGPTLTGLGGFFTCFTGLSTAVYGIAIVDYVAMVFPGILPYAKPAAVFVITLAFASTIKGSKFVSFLTNIMTVILLASIGLFIVVGLPKVQSGFFAPEGFFLNGSKGFIQAISIMAFACAGSTLTPVSMMAVTKKPKRTIPLMMVPITITVGLIYGLMGVVAAGVLPLEEIMGQNLAVVAKAIFPQWLYVLFILGGAVAAIATSLMSLVAALRYPIYQVAEDGWFPPVFKKTTKNGYPWVIQLLFYLIGIAPVLFGFSLESIASLSMIPLMLMNAYLNLSLIKVIKDYPEQWKKSVFHMPKGIFSVLCVVAAGCALVVAYTLFVDLANMQKILMVALAAALAVLAVIRLKTGAVKKEELLARREAIAAQALKLEETISE